MSTGTAETDAPVPPMDPVISDDDLEALWHDRSTPKQQFADLVLEEMSRIWDSDPRARGRTDKSTYVNEWVRSGWLYDRAREEVQAQWVEQGIWKESWTDLELGPPYTDSWKHEETVSTNNSPSPSSAAPGARWRPRWRAAETARQREASRPINMFLYQVISEHERLSAGRGRGRAQREDRPPPDDDINTRAYGAVRARWAARHVWDDGWGVLPGMMWRHEKPLPQFSGGDDDDDDDDGREEEEDDDEKSDGGSYDEGGWGDDGVWRDDGGWRDDDDDDDDSDDGLDSASSDDGLARAAGEMLMRDKEVREGRLDTPGSAESDGGRGLSGRGSGRHPLESPSPKRRRKQTVGVRK
ncbi:hypothetical protein GGR52DRAFT_575286 [Hypoxylon sp. FL1284]|nr:hypothetical protein GGR52DRAFT_575286 [Hypoxylon sp. FL1284]